MKPISTIIAEELPDGRYKYTVIYKDGKEEVVRKTGTKLYENAFQYSCIVCTGPKSELSKRFTFGKNPSRDYLGYLIATYPIIEVEPK